MMMSSNKEVKPSFPSPVAPPKIDLAMLQQYMLGNQKAEEIFAAKRSTTDCGDSPFNVPLSAGNNDEKSRNPSLTVQAKAGETASNALQKRFHSILTKSVTAPTHNFPPLCPPESFKIDPPTFNYKSSSSRTSIAAAAQAENEVEEPMVTVKFDPEEYIRPTHNPGVLWRKRDVDLLVSVSQKWKFLPYEPAKRRKTIESEYESDKITTTEEDDDK